MTKALTVLAECVDARNGKRYLKGSVFDPAPTLDQANRLISAGCLPVEARDLAVKAEAEAEKRAALSAEQRRKDEEAAAAFVEARTAKSAADQAVYKARLELASAVKPEDKTAAEKSLVAAETAAKAASDKLAKLSK